MERRRFLESLLLGAAALSIDPERLLWVPGAKRLFIPPPVIPADSLRYASFRLEFSTDMIAWKSTYIIDPEHVHRFCRAQLPHVELIAQSSEVQRILREDIVDLGPCAKDFNNGTPAVKAAILQTLGLF